MVSLVCLFSAPTFADEVDLVRTEERSVSDTPLWEFDYQKGIRTAQVGKTMGTAGVVGIVAGIGLIAVGFANGQDEFDDRSWLPLTGAAVGFTGLLAVQVGAPLAASGTIQSHRALVEGRQVDRGCDLCVISLVLSVPNPLSLLSLPASYIVSSQQQHSDRVRYHRYKGFPPPKVRLSRRGVGLSWQF